MARHRRTYTGRLLRWRRQPRGSSPAAEDQVDPQQVAAEPLPTEPAEVRFDYPDGTTHPVNVTYEGSAGRRHRWVAVVPDAVRVVNGMVIRVDRDVVLAVAVQDGGIPVPVTVAQRLGWGEGAQTPT